MEQYLIYLRKSRQDRDMEIQTGNYDTLQRHRATLMDLAKRRGYLIAQVFEEVVSGDTISERPEMRKLLSAVETGQYAGVLVMEVPRLARGNTRDQGTVAETFQYSRTKIITPDKIYDPMNEADEEYFEFGLFMSRREYKAINRRLQRGRIASLNEGKFVAGTAPYGYRKVRVPHQKGWTLEEDPERGEIVRDIFRLYTIGEVQADGTTVPIGSHKIANVLNARGIPSPGGIRWTAAAVREILKNPTYAGYLRWSYRPVRKQMVDGKVVTSAPVNPDMELRRGMHRPLISEETWTAARAVMSGRKHTPLPGQRRMSNPLAGILYCSVCGRSMVQLPNGCGHGNPSVACPTVGCPTVSSRRDVTETALLDALRSWLRDYQVDMEARGQQDTAQSRKQARAAVERARRNLETLSRQKSRLYDLLEQGVYTNEEFLERSRVLAARIEAAEAEKASYQEALDTLTRMEQERENLIPRIQNVLDVYDTLETPEERNRLLRTVVDRVVYAKSVGGRYQKSDLKLYVYPKLTPDVGRIPLEADGDA